MLTWFDRCGKVLGTVGTPGDLLWPAISPDGNTVVVDRRRSTNRILRPLAARSGTRHCFSITFNSKTNAYPVWSPDGSHIAFASTRDGVSNLYQKAASGAAQEEALG